MVRQDVEEGLLSAEGRLQRERRLKVDVRHGDAVDALEDVHQALRGLVGDGVLPREDVAAQDVAGALEVQGKAQGVAHLVEEQVGDGLCEQRPHGGLAQIAVLRLALVLDLVVDEVELAVHGAQVVIRGGEHLLHEAVHEDIAVVFIDDLVLDLGPEHVDQGLDLQLKPHGVAHGPAHAVDAVDGVAVVLLLGLHAAASPGGCWAVRARSTGRRRSSG